MKTATKIEIGIIAFVSIASFIFQLELRSQFTVPTNDKPVELSGIVESKIIQIGDFDTLIYDINIFGSINPSLITYKTGEPSVKITSDKVLLDQLNIEVKNNTLRLKSQDIRKKTNVHIVKESDNNFKIEITGPADLRRISTDKKCSFIFLDPIITPTMIIDMRNHSTIDINIATDSLDINASSHTQLKLKGNANYTNLFGGSHSTISGYEFQSKKLNMEVNNSFIGTMTITESVKGSVAGRSKLSIKGNPNRVIIKEWRRGELILVEEE